MTPEEKARVKIDKQLNNAGWEIVSRQEYVPNYASAVKEGLMQGNKESDYLLFIDDKAIAVVEAKAESNSLGEIVAQQAEWYSTHPQSWVGMWFENQIPLVYLANGNKIYFKNKPNIIMEIKANGVVPLWLVEILSAEKLYPQQFSKIGKVYERLRKEKHV